jgi:ribosomal protein L36
MSTYGPASHVVPEIPGGLGGVFEPAPKVGGSQPTMVKKTDRKTRVLSRERCIYVDCKRHQYIKLRGKFVRLTDARNM